MNQRFAKHLTTDKPAIAIGLALAVLLWSNSGCAATVDWARLFGREVLVEAVESSDGIPGVRATFVVNADSDEGGIYFAPPFRAP